MTKINELANVDTLSTADQLLLYSTANGDERRTSLNSLLSFINTNATPANLDIKQYSSPATGFSLQVGSINDYPNNIWLVLTPAGTLATGTLILPPASAIGDQKEILVNSTQTITALSFTLNGAVAGVGLPTTIAANSFFRLRFDVLVQNWYRI